MLHLVRHGRPLTDRSRPAAEWELDPAGFDDVWALRESGRLPTAAVWFCSAEPKAIETAQLLTESEVGVLPALGEQGRSGWIEDFAPVVTRAFADPARAAYDGWETIDACRERLMAALGPIAAVHSHDEVVLVGHGTAWTVLAAALSGREPDLARMRSMTMPDLIQVDHWS